MPKANIEIVLSDGRKAGQTLKELRQSANRLTREINDLTPGTEEFIQKSKDLKKVTDRLREVRGEVQNIGKAIKPAAGSIDDLTEKSQKLQKEVNQLAPGTDKFIAKSKELKQVNAQYDALKDEIDGVGKANSGIMGQFMQFIPFSGTINTVTGSVKGLSLGFKGLRMAIISTGIGALVLLVISIVTYFTKFQSGINFVSIAMSALGAVVNELIGRIGKFAKGLWAILSGDFKKGWNLLSESVTGFGESIKHAFNEGVAIERMRQDLKKLRREQELNILINETAAERNQAIADDATRSFKEREAANKRAQKSAELAAAQQTELAQKALDIANREFALKQKQGLLNDEVRQAQVDAMKEFIEAQKEETRVLMENEKTRRELKQDRLERDLDILIDGFDNVKTINEKILDDDKRTIDARLAKLEELRKLGDVSFLEQIKNVQQFTSKQINAYDLLNTADAKLLNQKIRNLELSEVYEGRLLEIIRERRTVIADFAEFEKELNEQRLEVERNIQDLRVQAMQEGMDKEMEQVMIDTERKIEALIGTEEQIREQKKLLLEIQEMELQAIRDRYTKERLEKEEKVRKEREKRDKEEAEKKKKLDEEVLGWQQDIEEAKQSAFRDTGNLIADLVEEEGKNAQLAKTIRKGIALNDIRINLQEQLSNIATTATEIAKVPIIGPALAAAYKVSMTAAAIASAAKQANDVRKLERGGILRGARHYAGGIAAVIRSSGEPIEMEDGEIVLTRAVGQDPEGRRMASNLNAAFGGRRFEAGGPVSPLRGSSKLPTSVDRPPVTAQGEAADIVSEQAGERLIQEIRGLRTDVNDWQRMLKVVNNLQEVEEGLSVLSELRNNSEV